MKAIDRRRARERAEREWSGRSAGRQWGPWRVSRLLDDWAAEVVAGTGLGSVPLHPAEAAHWAAVLFEPPAAAAGRRAGGAGIAGVAGALAAAAVRDRVLLAPEPGIPRLAWAVRDPDNGSPVAVGWGFRPDEARALVVLAGSAYPLDGLGGSGHPVGAAAVAGLIRSLAGSFGGGCRPATHYGRPWTAAAIGPTSWTGRPAPSPVMSVVVPPWRPAPSPGPESAAAEPELVGREATDPDATEPQPVSRRRRWPGMCWPGLRRPPRD